MTTIATDGKTMAADTLICDKNRVTNTAYVKLFRLDDGRVAGLAGLTYDFDVILAYLNGDLDEITTEDTAALILDHDGRVWAMDDKGRLTEETVPAAMGSGQEYAIGAMMAGATTAHAVGIAAQRDVYTGGERIHVMAPEVPAVPLTGLERLRRYVHRWAR